MEWTNKDRLDRDLEAVEDMLSDLRLKLYLELDANIRAHALNPKVEVLEKIADLRSVLEDFGIHGPARIYKAMIQQTKIALSAMRLTVEWVYQQDSTLREEMYEWPNQPKHLLRNIGDVFLKPWQVSVEEEGSDQISLENPRDNTDIASLRAIRKSAAVKVGNVYDSRIKNDRT